MNPAKNIEPMPTSLSRQFETSTDNGTVAVYTPKKVLKRHSKSDLILRIQQLESELLLLKNGVGEYQ